jgi:hypothetical protein
VSVASASGGDGATVVKAPRARPDKTAQAWIELATEDPEAVSALLAARARLAAGREVKGLRRLRLIELRGPLPTRPRLENLLHESIQFYNPHKERCVVRLKPRDPLPLGGGERVVLVTERGGERRLAAERWWRHETGKDVEVREGTAWVVDLGADPVAADETLADLASVRDRRHGLLCNPKCQDVRIAGAQVPLGWLSPEPAAGAEPSEEASTGAAASAALDGEER